MNYLQTDDRDDYFKSLQGKESKPRTILNLINPKGEIVKTGNGGTLNTYIRKEFNLPESKVRKGKWRKYILEKGFTIEPIK
jgi:hypothetical protein